VSFAEGARALGPTEPAASLADVTEPFASLVFVTEFAVRAPAPTQPVAATHVKNLPDATPSGPLENTPYLVPVPQTPAPAGPLAVPSTPKRVLSPPPVLVPNTPGEPPAADEFVPDTAGVAVVLVNAPVAASAAVGIKAITATIAPIFQSFFHVRDMRITSWVVSEKSASSGLL
jgi:hypothetical protein